MVRLLYVLGQSGRIQEAVDVAETEFAHWPHSADFHFELGHVLLKHALGNPQAAGDLLPLIESSWQHASSSATLWPSRAPSGAMAATSRPRTW